MMLPLAIFVALVLGAPRAKGDGQTPDRDLYSRTAGPGVQRGRERPPHTLFSR